MPVITRAAARASGDGSDSTQALGLRRGVTTRADEVWKVRCTDLYTGNARAETLNPEVDHCLEVQLAELALVRAYQRVDARPTSIATAQAHEMLRNAVNHVDNLNVTTKAINQAKRGPFSAAVGRLTSDKLRVLPLEQLARQGRATALVDDGTWANIEGAVVLAYDVSECKLKDTPALRGAQHFVDATMDELNAILTRLDVG